MRRIDLLIALVVLAAAIGSAIGAMSYTDTRLGTPFTVTWTTSTTDLPEATAAHSGAGESEILVPVNATNLTRAAFTVTIASDSPRVQPTQVRVEVIPPDGNGSLVQETTIGPGAAGSVEVPLVFELGAVPDVDTVLGDSPDDAKAKLAAQHARTNGTGEWRVLVQTAPGAPGPLGGTESYAITVTGALTRYEADVSVTTPEVRR